MNTLWRSHNIRFGRRLILGAFAATAIAAVLLGQMVVAQAASVEAGYRDFFFGTSASAPTGQKPQSKLWFNDGYWWGSLFDRGSTDYHIFRLDWATQTWTDTGTAIDDRPRSSADCLWDGIHLYCASAGTNSADSTHSARIYRYSYNSTTKSYSLDAGFPTNITSGGMEAIVFDRDTTGTLWATYTRANKVYVTHTTTDDRTWVTPYVLPVAGASNLDPDDISAAVAYNGQIGIMWSNQVDWAMYFARHVDGAPNDQWTVQTALSGTRYADDHINLKSLEADPSGMVFAAVKTERTTTNDPLIMLLVLKLDGTWTNAVFGRVQDNHTRPIVLLDGENRNVYMFAAAPCCSGGIIYYKQTSFDNPSFPPGLGTPFIKSSTDTTINNPTSTKQQLNSTTGLVVLAADDNSHYYLHNKIDLASSGPSPTPSPAAEGTPPTATSTATATNTPTPSATPGGSVFLPDADAYVDEALPNTNFGTSTSLQVDGGAGTSQESYLRFTVTGSTGAVQSARLRLYAYNPTGNGPAVYSTDNSWSETGITWNNRAPRTGGPSDDVGQVPVNSWTEYNVTPFVGGDGTYNFILAGTSTDGVDMYSREGAQPPQLVVTYSSGPISTMTPTLTPTETATPGDTPTATAIPTETATPDGTPTATTIPADTSTPTTTSTPTATSTPVPPETTIDSGPTGTTNSTSAAFTFSANRTPATFECDLDGAGFSPCTSPASYTGLAEGSHTFQVRATDADGLTDLTPASRTWTIDVTAPTVAITSPTDGAQVSGTAKIFVSAGDNNAVSIVQVYVDGSLIGSDTSSPYQVNWNTRKSSTGQHTLYALATDAAGNTAQSTTITVTVVR